MVESGLKSKKPWHDLLIDKFKTLKKEEYNEFLDSITDVAVLNLCMHPLDSHYKYLKEDYLKNKEIDIFIEEVIIFVCDIMKNSYNERLVDNGN